MRSVVISLSFFLLIVSCGVYTFSPSSTSGIKNIAIPVFDNQTNEYGLGETITSSLAEAFVADNTLKVKPENQADAVMSGTVISYSREAYTYTEAETVQEYKCIIGIKVKYENVKANKTVWDENLYDFGTYRSADETEQDGKDRAIKNLVNQILNKTVKDW